MSPSTSNLHRYRLPAALLLFSLPGALIGAQISSLLFFLNPQLEFSAGLAARSSLLFAIPLAGLSSLLLTLISYRRRDRFGRLLPWALTVVLTLGACLYWFNVSRYSYFLPPGINIRMIKAAAWLSALAIIYFYTALLHSLHRRPYGMRSLVGLTLAGIVSVFVLVERREAFEPTPPPPPLPSAIETAQRPRLFVVGVEAATLDAVLPLARQGRLPFLARILEEGAYAHLRSFSPPVRSALWTSLATGALPYKHGILGSTVLPADLVEPGSVVTLLPAPLGWLTHERLPGVRRSESGDRRAVALWEIVQRLGMPTGLVGWPVTFPVREAEEFAFSERFFSSDYRPGSASPAELAERGLLFRVEAEEIEDPALLLGLGDRIPFSFLNALSKDSWRESLFRFLLEQKSDVRAAFLLLPGLAEVSGRFYGGFAAAEFEGVQKKAHQDAAQAITSYYQHLDAFLAELWDKTEGARVLAVVSASGVSAPSGLGKFWSVISGTSLHGHTRGAPDGILLLLGDGIKPGTFLDRAELIDVVPTLLYSLGFPIARDLDGRVLTSAFNSAYLARHPLAFVPSYETLASEAPEHFKVVPLEE